MFILIKDKAGRKNFMSVKKNILIVLLIFLKVICCNKNISNEEKELQKAVNIEIKEFKKNPDESKAKILYQKGLDIQEKYPTVAEKYFKGTSEFIPMSNYQLSVYYYRANNKRKFEYWAKKASKQGISESSHLLGDYYIRKNKYKGIDYYILATKQGDAQAAGKLVFNYYLNMRSGKAFSKDTEQKIESILKECSEENKEIKENLGFFYEDGGEYDKAEKIYKELIEEKYEKGEKKLARMYYKLRRYDEAEEILLKILKKDNNNTEIIFSLADVYISQKRYNEAEEMYKTLLENTKEERMRDIVNKEIERLVKIKERRE